MRTLFLGLLLALTIQLVGQDHDGNPLNQVLNDIIHTQIANDLEYDIPVFVMSPYWFVYGRMSFQNSSIYFKKKNRNRKSLEKRNELIASDLEQYIRFNLISQNQLDGTLQIKSYSNKRLLLNINYRKENEHDIVEFSLPNRKYTKELKHRDDQLISAVTKHNDDYSMNNITYFGDSLIKYVDYDTGRKKFQLHSEKYEEGLLKSISYFKKSSKRDNNKLEEREVYFYDKHKRLKKIFTETKNGSRKDSTLFYYNDKQIVEKYFGTPNLIQNFYYDEQEHIKQKEIIQENYRISIDYEFDKEGRLINSKYSGSDSRIAQHQHFQYNNSGKLIGLSMYNVRNSIDLYALVSQYAFSYDDTGMIKSIKSMNSNGEIIKEISYDLQYLH